MSDAEPPAPDAAPDAASDAVPSEAGDALPHPAISALIRRRPKGDDGGAERTFYLVGTAHVSRQSVEDVREIIQLIKPDTVCVELDEMRYQALTDETRWRKLDIFQVIRQRKVLFLMASLALQAYQKRLGDQLGVRPGSELLAAVEVAKEVGSEVVLADRNVQATLKRTWANIRFGNKMRLLGELLGSVFDDNEISEEDVEALKDKEHINDMMTAFATAVPDVKEPLIDERDRFMMSMIEESPGDTVVAIVGAAHVDGMTKYRGEPVDRDALSAIPEPSLWVRAIKWIIPAIIIGAFVYGGINHDWSDLRKMVFAWVLPNAIMAALLTAIAGGKLVSVLSAFIASPITSLNPTVGAGMVVGLVEAWARKPTVDDCERLGTEVTTFAGMRKNPVSRTLMVAIAANIGSALGAWIGATWVLTYL